MKARHLVEEGLLSGHGAGPGCAMPVVTSHTYPVLGQNTISVLTASCLGTIVLAYPFSPTQSAPGVDLEKDIFGQMEFRPLMAQDLKVMDIRVSTGKAFGLRKKMDVQKTNGG